MNNTDFLTLASERAVALIEVRNTVGEAFGKLGDAYGKVHAVWENYTAESYRDKPEQVKAARTVTWMALSNIRDDIHDALVQTANLLAREIAQVARGAAEDQPVQFITSNSYMPPLRDMPVAEAIWQAGETASIWSPDETWVSFVEALESALDNEQVFMACPEYDNALYVVDLRRFEHSDNPDADDLNDEWMLADRPF
jgi:hypothetical protein